MNVSGINSTAFTGKVAKKDDNNRNLGKKIGTGIGVAAAAYGGYCVHKSGSISQAKALLEQLNLPTNKFMTGVKLGLVAMAAGTVAIGRWLGAGVDAIAGKLSRTPKEEVKCAHAVA